jgi:hypothetical protein
MVNQHDIYKDEEKRKYLLDLSVVLKERRKKW